MYLSEKIGGSHLVLLRELWLHLNSKWRIRFILLVFLMVVVAFSEVLTIGAVLPFLAALTSPASLYQHDLASPFIDLMDVTAPTELLLPMTIIFGVLIVVSALLRMGLIWLNAIFAYYSGGELGIEIYKNIIYQPYLDHSLKNSSEVINSIMLKTNAVTQFTILPVLTIISGGFIVFVVLIAFVVVNPLVAVIVYGSFGLMYLMVMKLMGRVVLENGRHIAHESTVIIKTIQESLEGIRDVIIDNSHEIHLRSFSDSVHLLKKSQGNNEVFGQSPRFIVEAMGMLMIIVSAYYMISQDGDSSGEMIAVFGVIVLAAQRLMPIVQQMYYAWTNVLSSKQSLEDALALLNIELHDAEAFDADVVMDFERAMILEGVDFSYPLKNRLALENIQLEVVKGDVIGIIGETGSGKSTLVDLIMGLFPPDKGKITVDGLCLTQENMRLWQSKISHVPQKIYLIDGSIAENIAYGIEKKSIDMNLVKKAAEQALVDQFVSKLPDKYRTNVGENGVLLSGGQRQRIGIARALYKRSEIIVLDEATSALDNKTEQRIMSSINFLDKSKTIFIISHRLSTLKQCTKIVSIAGGRIDKIMTYDELMKDHNYR